MAKKYHLFEVIGLELEYMLVKQENLQVNPIVDQLFTIKNGELTSDIDNGEIAWSNELVAHVIELKTNGPSANLENLDEGFAENITEINQLLSGFKSVLLPTASHPFMNPKTETRLWEHSYSEVYALYNRIFDCHGHGWSNVQSMHLNFPFYNDAEFEKLHAAIRVLLPILPALSASSPILEGKVTGFKDTRLEVYKTNQKEIPQLAGMLIPEAVFNKKDYQRIIFDPIIEAIKPFDTENILDRHFLNSRGAIARFDRNAIEIRVLDIQECPAADIAIAILIVETLKLLVQGDLIALEEQKSWHERELFQILNSVIKNGEAIEITDNRYLSYFGLSEKTSVRKIWKILYRKVKKHISIKHRLAIEFILNEGSLASRILKKTGPDFSTEKLRKLYGELQVCLQENKLFRP